VRADPRLLVVLAAVLWGTTGTARALGPQDASPTAVGAVRLIVGGVCLLAAARWRGLRAPVTAPVDDTRPEADGALGRDAGDGESGGDSGHSGGDVVPSPLPGAVDMAGVVDEQVARDSAGPRAGRRSGRPRTTATVLMAVVAMAAFQPLFFGGVARTGVAVGTVVGIGSSPVFAGLLGMAVRGERPGPRWLVATGLSLAGTLLLVGTGGGGDVDPLGVALALGAGLSYAVYVLGSKLALDGGWTSDALTVRVFGLASLVLVPVALVAGVGALVTPGGLLMIAHLGVVTVAVAYVLFGRGLSGVGVGAAGTLTLAEPATAAVLGVTLVGERLGLTTVAGIALIAGGLAVLVARRR
jgi:drug/metabolite transporter, DME family